MIEALSQASLLALVSTFVGVVPLSMGIVYAIWPNEQRLAVMRPVSLAVIFAAISGSTLGVLNVLLGMGTGRLEFPRVVAIGLSESLVPVFVGFGCLTVAWLCVAVGLWRRP